MGEYVSPVSPEQGGQTPQELNAEFNSIVEWLPKVSIEYEVEEVLNTTGMTREAARDYVIGRRVNSEFIGRLRERVSVIVAHAPVTNHFKKYIEFIIVHDAVYGVDLDGGEDDKGDFHFLDRNDPESGGIFEPNRARELEAYDLYCQLSLDINSGLTPSETHDEKDVWKNLPYDVLPRKDEIIEWGREFISYYSNGDRASKLSS